MAAEDVLHTLSQRGVNIGVGTAYRVLAELAAAGLLARSWVQGHIGAKAVYSIKMSVTDMNISTHQLACRRCGHSIPFFDANLTEHLSRIAELQGLKWEPRQSLTILMECLGCSSTRIAHDESHSLSLHPSPGYTSGHHNALQHRLNLLTSPMQYDCIGNTCS